jgi:hypothetical protein
VSEYAHYPVMLYKNEKIKGRENENLPKLFVENIHHHD